jgi:hypothetical protein
VLDTRGRGGALMGVSIWQFSETPAPGIIKVGRRNHVLRARSRTAAA